MRDGRCGVELRCQSLFVTKLRRNPANGVVLKVLLLLCLFLWSGIPRRPTSVALYPPIHGFLSCLYLRLRFPKGISVRCSDIFRRFGFGGRFGDMIFILSEDLVYVIISPETEFPPQPHCPGTIFSN